jgi:imidazolonepropionase-like amidohydrolase
MSQPFVASEPDWSLVGGFDEDDPGWAEFRTAVHRLVHASCCGNGGGGALAAVPMARGQPHRFARLGYGNWSATIRPSRPHLPVRNDDYVLPDVMLVEPDKPAREHVDLHVANGRIADIRPTGEGSAHRSSIVEKLRGHAVSPALTDLHTHLPPKNALNLTALFLLLHLRHGVVRTRDAGDIDGSATPAALKLLLSGALPGPEMHYAYYFVTTGRARWSNSLVYDHPDQAPEIIAQLQKVRATWVKSYENLDVPRLRALTEAAERAGVGVMGHVPTKLSVEEAAIPDSQHMWGVAPPGSLRRDHILNRAIDWHAVTPARLDAVVDACLAQKLVMTPTLASHAGLLRLADHEAESQREDARLMPRLYRDVIWHPAYGLPSYRGISADDFDRARRALDLKLVLTRKLAEAGVPLRLGTDVQQPFVVPGASIHKEIGLFEQAGISRSTAWSWASRSAAQTLGIDDSGAIEVGARADLLTSAVPPLMPGWHPKQVSAVITGGKLVLAEDLDAAIDGELGRFEGTFGRYIAKWLVQFTLGRLTKNFVN